MTGQRFHPSEGCGPDCRCQVPEVQPRCACGMYAAKDGGCPYCELFVARAASSSSSESSREAMRADADARLAAAVAEGRKRWTGPAMQGVQGSAAPREATAPPAVPQETLSVPCPATVGSVSSGKKKRKPRRTKEEMAASRRLDAQRQAIIADRATPSWLKGQFEDEAAFVRSVKEGM